MSVGRVVSGVVAAVAVAGCAVVVVGMTRAGADRDATARHQLTRTTGSAPSPSIPAQLPVTSPPHSVAVARNRLSVASRTPHPAPSHESAASTTIAASTLTPAPRATPTRARPDTTRSRTPTVTRTVRPTALQPAHSAARRGVSLPLRFPTGSAARVITVVARSTSSTTATLQAWNKSPGGGWLKYGDSVLAHVGSDGLSRAPSETRSATPIGSFTLTHGFGRYANPGTTLPYRKTTPADWWISQPGRLYNTLQHCSSHCVFTRGDPNEHLYYEIPYYDYAVVIDYNTRNTGHVRQGAGSAFFLHVTDGNPTAGCVSIPQSRLVPIVRWLRPSQHPRILIGTP